MMEISSSWWRKTKTKCTFLHQFRKAHDRVSSCCFAKQGILCFSIISWLPLCKSVPGPLMAFLFNFSNTLSKNWLLGAPMENILLRFHILVLLHSPFSLYFISQTIRRKKTWEEVFEQIWFSLWQGRPPKKYFAIHQIWFFQIWKSSFDFCSQKFF